MVCSFEPQKRGVGTMYNVHLRLTGKHIVDFLLVLIELFSLSVTAEALRAKIDKKNRCFASGWVSIHQIFS